MTRLQLHVEPDWLFVLCRECGFSEEQSPPVDVPGFRYAVASHVCSTSPGPLPSLDPQQELF